MIGVIQRVQRAAVRIDGETVGAIDRGILALVAVEKQDQTAQLERLAQRLLNYRIFPDAEDRMNLSLRDIDGGLLLVPQFTLAADTGKGNRPSFGPAAEPEQGQKLFQQLLEMLKANHPHVASGRFGADMQVELINDGPVTFILRTGAG